MKKLIYVFVALLLSAGCKKEEKLKFAELPQDRMEKAIEHVNSLLGSANNGWIVTLSTLGGGGYGFYMGFDDANQRVTMFGDLTSQTSNRIKESTYRVRQDMGVMLVFDTYNYISLLNDPRPEAFGGATGSGYQSDIDFIFEREATDSLVFRGKKYGQKLIMVRATADQKQGYYNNGYAAAINRINEALSNMQFPYIEVVSGTATIRVGIDINSTNTLGTGKRISFTGILADGSTAKTAVSKYAYIVDGINLLDGGLVWNGITFIGFKWINNTTLAVYDSTGREYIVRSSATPILSLSNSWGVKYSGFYTSHPTEPLPVPTYPGTSTEGATLLNTYHANARWIRGYPYYRADLLFIWNLANRRLTLEARLYYTSISYVVNTTVYNYTIDSNGRYSFTTYTPSEGSVNGGLIIGSINDFMLNNKVALAYHTDAGLAYVKMTSVQNPATVMTFLLKEL